MADSIYRGRRPAPADSQDVTITRPGWDAISQRIVKKKDYSQLRRASPSDKLLPRTVDWILELPPGARPHILATRFARIANQFALVWHDPVACSRYFDDLMTDRRGGRKGFPPWLERELVVLRQHYERLHAG